MKLRYSIALSIPLFSATAMAADLALKIDVPQLNVAEYHRPYIAAWMENADQKVVANLTVLYDVRKKDNGGAKYLKDLRQWWRKWAATCRCRWMASAARPARPANTR